MATLSDSKRHMLQQRQRIFRSVIADCGIIAALNKKHRLVGRDDPSRRHQWQQPNLLYCGNILLDVFDNYISKRSGGYHPPLHPAKIILTGMEADSFRCVKFIKNIKYAASGTNLRIQKRNRTYEEINTTSNFNPYPHPQRL